MAVYTPPLITKNFQFSTVTRADFIFILHFFDEIFLKILLHASLVFGPSRGHCSQISLSDKVYEEASQIRWTMKKDFAVSNDNFVYGP
jgi:hypothetical protein